MGKLRFTGNWYIDLGILGFKNMLDSYNIDEEQILQLPEDSFRKCFVVLFLINEITTQARNNLGKVPLDKLEKFYEIVAEQKKHFIGNNINDLLKKFSGGDFKQVCNSIFEDFQKPFISRILKDDIPSREQKKGKITYREFIENIYRKDRLWIDSNFYKNFAFYNPSSTIKKQIEDLEIFLTKGKIKSKNNRERIIEFSKTLNKFLPSSSEFSNEFYVPSDISELIKIFDNLLPKHIFYPILLTLPKAFVKIRGVNYVFYSPDIDFSFKVNLRLRKYLEQLQKNKKDNEIFNITWRSILDVLIEQKSFWALNNMYIISYKRISNEIIEGVEYIGIEKNKAKIIIDDKLRNNLNILLNFKGGENKWLIMEYLKGSSLFEICMKYIKGKENKIENLYPIFTALAVEAISINKVINSYKAFYFEEIKERAQELISKIKDEIKRMKMANNIFKTLLKDNLNYYLINQIKERRKDKFLNQILKVINDSDISKNQKEFILDYILNKILYNNKNWYYYALPLII